MDRKLNMRLRFILVSHLLINVCFSQNYNSLKIKEQYDFFNTQVVGNKPCTISPNSDEGEFGDSQSFVFDSYITMFKTTQDKAYLYKCMFEIMCVVENRHDIAGINSEPRWGSPYQDGFIIGSMARYVHFIKKELPFNPHQPMHSFSKFQSYDWNQPVNYPDPIPNGINTFWLFADWLAWRIDETLDWYISNGTFDLNKGMLENQSTGVALYLNMHVGFARAALFNGITDPNTCCYIPRANNIASNIKGGVAFTDRCEGLTYNQNVLRYESSHDAYWWYHTGWAVQRIDCWDGSSIFRPKEPRYSKYTEFVEDMSHAAVDIMMFNDFHNFQANGNFTTTDMIRFRNTFTKYLYDGAGGFYNAVNRFDAPITQGSLLHNSFAKRSMCFMPLEEYDVAAANTPNVYNIIMDYYQNNISSLASKPNAYDGQDSKGHADVVAAQWKHECTNLELYNRNVVYNQDFFSNNKLTIIPGSNLSGTPSYAEPLIYTNEFIVQPNVIVNMIAGESIILKPGVQIKSGSTFNASVVSIHPCNNGFRLASGSPGKSSNSNSDFQLSNPIENNKQVVVKAIKLRAVPNPFSNSTSIQFSLDKESKVNLKLIDNFGRVVYETIEDVNCGIGFNEVSISTESLALGLYNCILKINNEEIKTINIVKQ